MTLKSILKPLCETRYLITAHMPDGNYDRIEIDYLNRDIQAQYKNIMIRADWEKAKNKVKFVTYNKSAGCIEIDIDIL